MTVESTAARKPRRSAGSKAGDTGSGRTTRAAGKSAEPELVQLLTPEGKRVKNAKNAEFAQYVAGVTPEDLVTRIRNRGHRDARVIDRPEALAPLLASRVADGDYVVCLGAGNITQWAAALPGELEALMGEKAE